MRSRRDCHCIRRLEDGVNRTETIEVGGVVRLVEAWWTWLCDWLE